MRFGLLDGKMLMYVKTLELGGWRMGGNALEVRDKTGGCSPVDGQSSFVCNRREIPAV